MVHAWKSARIIGAIAIELFIYVSEQETMVSEIAQTDNFNDKTNIKVVGVGGAGGNAVNRMIAEGLQSVEFIAINTDAKDLLRSDADVKISLNDASSRGLGAGADPEKGAKAAQDHQSDIEEALKGSDMVFVTCGEGGGTGTGASPIVARAAHQQGALTIAVVTRPFSFEGPQRSASAALGIENLRKEVDALIVIPNDRLLELSDRTIGIVDAFKTADTALLTGVPMLFCALCMVITLPGGALEKVLLVVVALLYTLLSALAALALGLKMPNLTWTNETTPIKQSGCVMLALFADWFYAIALGGLYFLCGRYLSAAAYLALAAAITAAVCALLLRWVKQRGTRIFAAL